MRSMVEGHVPQARPRRPVPLHHPAPQAQFILSDAAGGVEGGGPPPPVGEDQESFSITASGMW
jgi:hypothetical protein